eukprot:2877140-Pyramimonas_sp.AAC.1
MPPRGRSWASRALSLHHIPLRVHRQRSLPSIAWTISSTSRRPHDISYTAQPAPHWLHMQNTSHMAYTT